MTFYRLGVIGDPISHSLSPKIHLQLAEIAKIKIDYQKFQVNENNIAQFVEDAKNNLDGFNVTMPDKQNIIQYCNEVSEFANEVQAVNTVSIHRDFPEEKLFGDNTDGPGFFVSLPRSVKNVLIFGTGGAARAIGWYLHLQNIPVSFATIIENDSFADFPIYKYDELEPIILNFDLFVNATNVGMKDDQVIYDVSKLPINALIYDIVYKAKEQTQFIKNAQAAGFETMQGRDLLLSQAILSFNIWTNQNLKFAEIKDLIEL